MQTHKEWHIEIIKPAKHQCAGSVTTTLLLCRDEPFSHVTAGNMVWFGIISVKGVGLQVILIYS